MTAYDSYLRASKLHSPQHPVSDTEGELSFPELWSVRTEEAV
jgi:hypothetical protein